MGSSVSSPTGGFLLVSSTNFSILVWAQWTVPWLQILLFGGFGFMLCGKKKNAPKMTAGETASMRTIIAPPPPPPAPMLKADSGKKKSEADKPKETPPVVQPVATKEKEKEEADDKEEKNELFNDAVVEKMNSYKKDGLHLSVLTEKTEEKKSVNPTSEVRKASEVKKPESQLKTASVKESAKEEDKENEKRDEDKKEPKEEEKKPVVDKKGKLGGRGLEVEPTELRWTSESDQQTFKATNTTDKRLVYKVKTSDAVVFSVLPNLGFLSEHESVSVSVLRAEAPMKEAQLIVVYCEATAEDKEPQEVFKRHSEQHHHSTIKMLQK